MQALISVARPGGRDAASWLPSSVFRAALAVLLAVSRGRPPIMLGAGHRVPLAIIRPVPIPRM
jgi:hypothetical protein